MSLAVRVFKSAYVRLGARQGSSKNETFSTYLHFTSGLIIRVETLKIYRTRMTITGSTNPRVERIVPYRLVEISLAERYVRFEEQC